MGLVAYVDYVIFDCFVVEHANMINGFFKILFLLRLMPSSFFLSSCLFVAFFYLGIFASIFASLAAFFSNFVGFLEWMADQHFVLDESSTTLRSSIIAWFFNQFCLLTA